MEKIGRIRAKFALEYREEAALRDIAVRAAPFDRLNAVFYIRLIPSGFTRERSASVGRQSQLPPFAKFQIHRRVKIPSTYEASVLVLVALVSHNREEARGGKDRFCER